RARQLAQITGVGEVTVTGASLPAVRVQLDPGALLHNGIALDEVRNAITQSTALYPLGFVEEDQHRWRVGVSDSLRTAEQYRQLVIRHDYGAVGRVGGLAKVSDSDENRYTSGMHNDRPAVTLMVSRQSGANIVRSIDAIHEQLPQLQALMPTDSELVVVMDRSPVIRATLNEAQFTLMLASLLVVLVVWLFLGSARTALIPSVALPVSLVGSFVGMYLYGFSLNNLSLLALIVAAGLVVDDAIVVLENVERHIESGLPPLRAALRGAGEVGFTLLAMNLALVVVFVSILFMGGVVERLFREFSITLAAAMLISLLVSLTVTPSLCALWLKGRQEQSPGRLARCTASLFDGLQDGYRSSLDWRLRHGVLVLLAPAAVVAGNAWLYVNITKETLPQQDTGQIRGFVRGDDGFSFQVMQPKIDAFRQHILADPAVPDLTGSSGGAGGATNPQLPTHPNPLEERAVSSQRGIERPPNGTPKRP